MAHDTKHRERIILLIVYGINPGEFFPILLVEFRTTPSLVNDRSHSKSAVAEVYASLVNIGIEI